jgi:hypothetical protein
MSTTYVVRDLLHRLSEDQWRRDHPFSPEMETVNKVLFHPFSEEADKKDALMKWMQRPGRSESPGHQPCLFGRVAAANNALHLVLLDDDDLRESDQNIAERLQQGRRAWWQRSRSPREGVSTPAHGFVLCITSQRVNFAEPNETLQQFSQEILSLWGCRSTTERQGVVHWEEIFLENPNTERFVRFEFSVDFFAAAGDRRWWHDHRIPGGIAFTANSVGHMRRYREWYEGQPDQKVWLLETAMGTIAEAAKTDYGQATWLRPLIEGRPFVSEIACPMLERRAKLEGFDWTRYAGHLHTDHAIRPEFFRVDPEKPTEAKKNEWVLDFQYLYDPRSRDHIRFVEGTEVSKEEVDEKVGRPEDYVYIASPRKRRPKREGEAGLSDMNRRAEVEALLDECKGWALSPEEKLRLNG